MVLACLAARSLLRLEGTQQAQQNLDKSAWNEVKKSGCMLCIMIMPNPVGNTASIILF